MKGNDAAAALLICNTVMTCRRYPHEWHGSVGVFYVRSVQFWVLDYFLCPHLRGEEVADGGVGRVLVEQVAPEAT